jgi:formylglycine-generating enzyme required for sulfatase activity
MHGNVSEWCLDHFRFYEDRPDIDLSRDECEATLMASAVGLAGGWQILWQAGLTARVVAGTEVVTTEVFRAVRGGSVSNNVKSIRSAKRFSDRPALSDIALGFRVARSRP